MQYLSPILIGLGFCIGQVAFSQTSNVEKGLALFQHGQYEGAVREFEEANRVQPNNPTLENMVGLANSQLGRLDEADLHFEKDAFESRLPDPHKNLGFNCLNAKRYDLAAKELRTALDLDPSDQFARYYLGMVYIAMARNREAVEQLEGAQSLLDNDPAMAVQFVMACLRVGPHQRSASLARKIQISF